jgi:hypothetical protein
MIPRIDENIEWSCEDCNIKTKESECIMNGQGSGASNDDFCLSIKENLISNVNACANGSNVAYISQRGTNEESCMLMGTM